MLSERLGHVLDKPLAVIARTIPFSPNALSAAGFVTTLIACYILSYDFFFGGILVLVGSAFDMLDGVVARTNNKVTLFGAFLDSVLDRYADAAILLAIAYHLRADSQMTGVVLCMVALVGSLIVSYTRARAEGLGKKCKVGLLERPERIILISLGAISGLIMPALWVLAVLTNVTVMQRICHVWKGTRNSTETLS